MATSSPTSSHDPAAALDHARRRHAALEQAAGWLLGSLQAEADCPAFEGEGLRDRIDRFAKDARWPESLREELLAFADRYEALRAERDRLLGEDGASAEQLTEAAFRFEQAGSRALALYMESQARAAASAAALAASLPDESDEAGRQRHLAEIGAAVRAKLDVDPRAEKLRARGLEIYALRGFADAEECRGLIALIDRSCYPSGILGENPDKEFRTSSSCDLERHLPLVDRLDRRICELLDINRRFSEPVQGQRYQVGQQFKPHHDFFHKGQNYYDHVQRQGGQRSWTAMLFLNEPEAGGCTNFPEAAVMATPEAGKLLVWNNMKPDGSPNPASLHQGMPVEAGVKYVITKWFRERAWG